jgi:hypothetical protein
MNAITFFPAVSGSVNPIPLSLVSPASASTSALSPQTQTNSSATASPNSDAAASSAVSKPPVRTSVSTYTGGAAPAASSASVAVQLTSSQTFSTTIGGKQYSESISQSGGEYTASVPNLPGATATGTSELAAEESLYERIDVLV